MRPDYDAILIPSTRLFLMTPHMPKLLDGALEAMLVVKLNDTQKRLQQQLGCLGGFDGRLADVLRVDAADWVTWDLCAHVIPQRRSWVDFWRWSLVRARPSRRRLEQGLLQKTVTITSFSSKTHMRDTRLLARIFHSLEAREAHLRCMMDEDAQKVILSSGGAGSGSL